MALPPNGPRAKLLAEREIERANVRHCGVSMTTVPVINDQSAGPRYQRLRRVALLATAWIVLLTLSACVFRAGVQLRHWAWTHTQNMHFQGDATHAYFWGTYADRNGLPGMYRQIRSDYGDQPPQSMGLDYSPLRLTIVTIWAQWVNRHFEANDQWDQNSSYQFHRPLLLLNAGCEAAAAVGVVLVLRLMRRIVMPSAASTPGFLNLLREYLPLAIAALLVWFNPALILNDCWPQWDAWILPCFIFALYFSMRGWWFSAGALLAVGAMLKGQILFVAPVFLLWPLFLMRWLPLARLVAGFAVAITLIAIPWMLTGKGDVALACTGAIVSAALLIFRKGWRRPVFQLLAAAAFVAPVWLAPRILTGDLSWFVLPFEYGPTKHPELSTVGTSNLAALLHEQWGWEGDSPVDLPLPFGRDLQTDLRTVLVALYAICLIACGIAAAVQWRRRDWRFLLAMYAPWVLFFALMPYLNNRYLLWASAFFPLLIPLGLGMTLLGGLVCLSCCAMLVEIMCRVNPDSDPTLQSLSHGMYPGLAFAVLLIAAIFLYNAAIFRQSKRPA
jgi:MFS family permease